MSVRLKTRLRRAFTLIEVLLAMSIAGIVMVALSSLLFGMVGIMEGFEDEDSFETHVNSVENFLQSSLSSSRFPANLDSSVAGKTFSGNVSVSLGVPPSHTSSDDLMLSFGVDADHPFYAARLGFSPEKVCWMEFDKDGGISILWCFANPEETLLSADDRPVYRSLVTPYFEKVEYLYYYTDRKWVAEDRIRSGDDTSTQLPAFVKITFKRGDERVTRMLAVFSLADPYLYSPETSGSSSSGRGSSSGGDSPDGGAEGGNEGGSQGGEGGSSGQNPNRPGEGGGMKPGGSGGGSSGGGSSGGTGGGGTTIGDWKQK